MLVAIFCTSCQFKLDKAEDDKADETLAIERFDRLQCRYFTTGDYAALQQMNTQYPTETRTLIENFLQLGEVNDPDINSRLLSFYQDSVLQQVLSEVQLQYADMSDVSQSLSNAFQKMRRLMPNVPTPHVYTQIGALSQSIIVSDTVIGISLDKYLGEDYQPYAPFFDEEERQTMTRANIVPDCVLFYLLSVFPLKDFENRTYEEREDHLGRVMWATNQIVGKTHFKTPEVKKAAEYVRQHPHTSVLKMLAIG
ncbi:MAG: gliding motility protein GldB [Prevotella sp.]|nr:gliding motility protein GldB [Prevotella sp.]